MNNWFQRNVIWDGNWCANDTLYTFTESKKYLLTIYTLIQYLQTSKESIQRLHQQQFGSMSFCYLGKNQVNWNSFNLCTTKQYNPKDMKVSIRISAKLHSIVIKGAAKEYMLKHWPISIASYPVNQSKWTETMIIIIMFSYTNKKPKAFCAALIAWGMSRNN